MKYSIFNQFIGLPFMSKVVKSATALGLLFTMTAVVGCSEDEKEPPRGDGSPTISIGEISPALMGDSITINVNCTDGSVALSTLKANLLYSEEVVEQVTLRTKENGSYKLRMFVPYYKNVPDGKAKLHLTLQNIHFTTAEKEIEIPVSRPHYQYLTLVAGKTTYKMMPDSKNPYLFRCKVNSPDSKTVMAYVQAPAAGANGNVINFGQGALGITQNSTDPINFANVVKGEFECTFNTLTYEYSPVYDPSIAAQEVAFAADALEYDGEFVQGRNYEFVGLDELKTPDWFYDPDFFTDNGNGTYKFNAITGTYHVKANLKRHGFQVWATKADKSTEKLSADGTGAVWIIGDDGIGKPAYSFIAGQGWWTDTDHALCLAQVKDRVYQITLTVGKQLRAGSINFKFFGQAGWGTEFKGSDSDYHVSSTSDIFKVGTGADGHDNGNLYLSSKTAIADGETYVLTLDLTAGVANGVLSVTKK